MKTNKKAILGMLVAMVMSLGFMHGINVKIQTNNDTNLQQCWAVMMAYGNPEMTPGENCAAGVYGAVLSGAFGLICPPLGFGMAV